MKSRVDQMIADIARAAEVLGKPLPPPGPICPNPFVVLEPQGLTADQSAVMAETVRALGGELVSSNPEQAMHEDHEDLGELTDEEVDALEQMAREDLEKNPSPEARPNAIDVLRLIATVRQEPTVYIVAGQDYEDCEHLAITTDFDKAWAAYVEGSSFRWTSIEAWIGNREVRSASRERNKPSTWVAAAE